jgi:aminocarboxymuconate-semialdehyde decarboxylase
MSSRRTFVKSLATAAAGLAFPPTLRTNPGLEAALAAGSPDLQAPPRREVTINGRRVRVVDVHAHCSIPEAAAGRGRGGNQAPGGGQTGASLVLGPSRLAYMDAQGIDIQVLSINPSWYGAARDAAQTICSVQNEQLAAWCAKYPTRFVALASVALQFPELAATQLEEGVKKLGLRGAAIGGSVEGEELSSPRFDPFWAKAQELNVPIFMHPQTAQGTTQNTRLQGRGGLGNTIGNPLETTVFLSHLIFEGTLDRFPGLRICAAHAGGYLPSYSGRSDALCGRGGGGDCTSLKKKPSEYFRKELFVDSMIFHEEGLRHLVAEMGSGQIVYGTDYPYDWPVGVDFVLNASFLSDSERESILGGNAAALFGLNRA